MEALQKAQVDPESLSVEGTDERMTLQDRFRRVMQYRKVDRIPFFEFGYWEETLGEWHEQGLPPDVTSEWRAYQYFGIENWHTAPIDTGMRPGFEGRIIEETEDRIVAVDGQRCTYEINKKGHKSIPHYLDFGLKTRADWADWVDRLDPDDPGRYPDNWDELAARYNKRDYPLAVPIGSLIGTPRNWIGFQNIGVLCYDDPGLMEEIIEKLCVLVCRTLERALRDVEFDFGAGWEDICFNSGPIISPKFFDAWIVPRYKRITDLLHKHGCHIAWTDCDGNIAPIVKQFLEGGINCMFPVEVAGGSDPVSLRQTWGTQLLLVGGVCKHKLAAGREAIRAELERLRPTVEEGGFIPTVDHRVPAGVKFDDYRYYLKLKREMLGCGALEPEYDESKV
jgi:uroporphyrinogen decarboxylase